MTRRDAIVLLTVNALVSAAMIATAAVWFPRIQHPPFALLDVAELYRLKESQVSAVLVKRDASETERAAAVQAAAGFGNEVTSILDALPAQCGCLVLTRGAVVGAPARLPDLTPDVRRRLGL